MYPVNDDNVYAVGSIRGHHVVVAYLTEGRYGKIAATTIARQMICSFPAIKFGFKSISEEEFHRKFDLGILWSALQLISIQELFNGILVKQRVMRDLNELEG